MAWWLWLIIGIAVWTACAWLTALWSVVRREQRVEDIGLIDFIAWPFFLCFYIAKSIVDVKCPFSLVGSINTVATKIERKAELRNLREMHEVKEEETYPIPFLFSEAQWHQAQERTKAHLQKLQNTTGGKNES